MTTCLGIPLTEHLACVNWHNSILYSVIRYVTCWDVIDMPRDGGTEISTTITYSYFIPKYIIDGKFSVDILLDIIKLATECCSSEHKQLQSS